MTRCYREAVVSHGIDQVYALVNDVASYHQFVPRCVASEVLASEADTLLTGRLTFDAGIRQVSLTSRNVLTPPDRIQMHLVDGPFRQFGGEWRFEALEDHQTRVTMDFHFALSRGLAFVFEPLFAQIVDRLIESFRQRADEIYGA